jgi:hypothetical protein
MAPKASVSCEPRARAPRAPRQAPAPADAAPAPTAPPRRSGAARAPRLEDLPASALVPPADEVNDAAAAVCDVTAFSGVSRAWRAFALSLLRPRLEADAGYAGEPRLEARFQPPLRARAAPRRPQEEAARAPPPAVVPELVWNEARRLRGAGLALFEACVHFALLPRNFSGERGTHAAAV